VYQFSVTAGTIFNDSHLSLKKWFIATYLICESRKGFSANEMKRILGGSYKTAWYLCHRIRRAMKQTEQAMLDGTVEMDETYVGGVKRGRQWMAGEITRNASLVFASATVICDSFTRKMLRAELWRDTSKRTFRRMLT
jgi:hypothetical protein